MKEPIGEKNILFSILLTIIMIFTLVFTFHGQSRNDISPSMEWKDLPENNSKVFNF